MDHQTKLILASSSPARKKVLEDAGFIFSVLTSEVDENAILEKLREKNATFSQQVVALAEAKAKAVYERIASSVKEEKNKFGNCENETIIIVGCDSMFEFENRLIGKPEGDFNDTNAVNAVISQIMSYSGKCGVLHTGHCVVILKTDDLENASLKSIDCKTLVKFAAFNEETAKAYFATGEPQSVAGAFAIDGKGGSLIEGIEGDYFSVVGISPNCVRTLIADNTLFSQIAF